LRPFFVLIRFRKPCTFFRLLTFGLNVGFILPDTSRSEFYHDNLLNIHFQADRSAPIRPEKCLYN